MPKAQAVGKVQVMSDHAAVPFERHCDVAVIGGSAAGLAAALQLGRQRRSVIVVDSGDARNAPAAHLHGYLGLEGIAPAQLLAAGRQEVRSYGGEVVAGRAVRVTRDSASHLRVELAGGHTILARRVLAATGTLDLLPDIDGLAAQWGRGVIHCPFCHGYEARDLRIVQIVTHPMGLHTVPLIRQLTDRHTLVLDEAMAVEDAELDTLRAGGVGIGRGQASRILSDDSGTLTAVELDSGDRIPADAVVILPRFRARVEPFEAIGLHASEHPAGLGTYVETDPNGATSVPGLYAAGNVTDPSQQVSAAAAAGSKAGAAISLDLAEDDLQNRTRASANEADWDHRYSGNQLWSGNPNGTLVDQITGLAPGSALDVGAGEGGDALWLAARGWQATANDVSRRALDRIAANAAHLGLHVECRHADANALDAFAPAAYDLVTAHYASIPRTPDNRAVHTILAAVAPGGTLLVVSHDPEPLRAHIDTRHDSRPFDADAYVRTDDFTEALAASPLWDVEIHEKRPRPPGAASAAHHADDIVLRAHRRPDTA
jgi:thioredoxin reductase/SAM-dependent methyltransferase